MATKKKTIKASNDDKLDLTHFMKFASTVKETDVLFMVKLSPNKKAKNGNVEGVLEGVVHGDSHVIADMVFKTLADQVF